MQRRTFLKNAALGAAAGAVAAGLALTAGLAAVGFAKAVGIALLGEPRSKAASDAREVGAGQGLKRYTFAGGMADLSRRAVEVIGADAFRTNAAAVYVMNYDDGTVDVNYVDTDSARSPRMILDSIPHVVSRFASVASNPRYTWSLTRRSVTTSRRSIRAVARASTLELKAACAGA